MNLEDIEQRSLKYLMESSTPLVPVDTLLRFLQRHGEFPELSEQELVDFLRHHELFRVIEPLPLGESAGELAEIGFMPKPRVVLVTRLPSAYDLKQGMQEELDRMLEALSAALESARRQPEKARKVRALIQRAKQLQRRIEEMM